jgi:CheY-like chemotaxis protein
LRRQSGEDGTEPLAIAAAKGFLIVAKKILAVDDETDVLLVIKTALLSEGFEVTSATNGREALEKIPAEKPDLVILDVMMPGMTGFEVLEKMKADPAMAHIPVIMLTGLSERSKIREALESGTDYYIVKPFDFHDLMSKVNDALNSSTNDPFQL